MMWEEQAGEDYTIARVLKSARREQKITRRVNVGFGLSILLLLGAVTYVVTNYQPQTACSADAESHECQQLRAETAHAQTKRVACIPFRQVGYICPAPEMGPVVIKRNHKDKKSITPDHSANGGSHAAPQSPAGTVPSGGPESPASPPSSGDGGSDGGVGNVPQTPPDPSAPGPEGPPGPPGPSGPPAPPSQPDDPTLGGSVDQVVDGVGGVVGGAKGQVCNALGVCLP